MKIEAMRAAELSDADLVTESLSGDRDAFGQIVERYQTLIASLAYCATGNVTQSEDLAQETFVSAWKQLADLREPAKLRPWLCSITRFLVSKEFRRQGREPIHEAQSLETLEESTSPEPLPLDHAISQEELSLLWRSLERVPPIYREPLVLFYREHQSIEAVAEGLGLSEDAVKQRLSRGRKFLQQQFMAFVAGALKQTSPGKAFTLGVIAALPLLATTAKAAIVGAVLAQNGSVAAKTTTLGGFLQAISKIPLGFAGWLAPMLPVGGYIGYKMGGDRQHDERARRSVATFWSVIGFSMLLLIFLPVLLVAILEQTVHMSHPAFYAFSRIWMEFLIPALTYAVAPLSLALWIWQRRRPIGPGPADGSPIPARAEKSSTIWVVLGMTGALVSLVFLLWGSVTVSAAIARHPELIPKTHYLSTAEVQKLIARSQGTNLDLCLSQFRNGYRQLYGDAREDGTPYVFQAPAEDSTLALLAQKGNSYKTRMEGRDFSFSIRTVLWMLGQWAIGLFMPAFCLFIVIAGAVTLLRRRDPQSPEPGPIAAVRNERRVDKAFAAFAACGMVAIAILLGLTTDWKVRRVAAHQLAGIVAQHKNARFEVFEYRNGSRKLWISDVRSPEFIAPANESTLGLLTGKGITYQTYLADIDWWYQPRGLLVPYDAQDRSGCGRLGPSRSISALVMLVLAAAGGWCLWLALKSRPTSTFEYGGSHI